MSQSMQVAIWVVAMLLLGVLAWHARRWLRAHAHREFEDLVFRTPVGPVRGARMQVVKRIVHAGESAFGPSRGVGASEGSAFYYCRGPGPSYFLAVRLWPDPRRGEGAPGEWAVTPLAAERMRDALVGDEDALALAFGDVVDDRLRA